MFELMPMLWQLSVRLSVKGLLICLEKCSVKRLTFTTSINLIPVCRIVTVLFARALMKPLVWMTLTNLMSIVSVYVRPAILIVMWNAIVNLQQMSMRAPATMVALLAVHVPSISVRATQLPR